MKHHIRKKKPASERHNKVVSTSHTSAQLRRLKELADDVGLGTSSYASRVLHAHINDNRGVVQALPKAAGKNETDDRQHDEFFWLGHQFIRKSAIIAMHWRDPHRGTCAEGRDPWQLELLLVNGINVWLSTTPAAIVLKTFGLPTANPHPTGTDNEHKK